VNIINNLCGLIAFIGCKNFYLAGRADLFKISNLFKGGKKIVSILYSSLEGTERDS
jgi:hypothetical protein